MFTGFVVAILLCLYVSNLGENLWKNAQIKNIVEEKLDDINRYEIKFQEDKK